MRTTANCALLLLVGILIGGCGGPANLNDHPAPALLLGRIAFSSDRAGSLDIYTADPDLTQVRRLTVSSDDELSPAWSPDRNRLAFQRWQGGHWNLWVMNADGTGKTQLTSGKMDTHPCWSPDGTRIAFARDADAASGLYSVNSTTGGALKQLTSGSSDTNPCWGPNNKIVYRRRPSGGQNGNLAILNVVTKNIIDLPNTADLLEPSWSPDGTKIACVGLPPGKSATRVYVINANGSGRVKLTDSGQGDSSPCWAPGGTKILFARSIAPQWDLFAVDVATKTVTRLTQHTASDRDPAWTWPH